MNLDEMKFPMDIPGLSTDEARQLAYELRKFLIKSVSKTGGHLASNLVGFLLFGIIIASS